MPELLKILLIGMVMGAAEVVPGVSGGTIAFISGIYERLVNALRQFTPWLLVAWKEHGFVSVWRRVDGLFLVTLFGGMGVSIVLLAGLIGWLLNEHAILIWAFFSGLVLASILLVAKQIERFGLEVMLAASAGILLGVVITTLVPIDIEPAPWFFFAGGVVAICAWILPGLSGSFILLILGLYAFVLDAVHQRDLVILGSLAAGCAVGIVSFAQVLARLFRFFRDQTLALLSGFMLGSLVKLWPWKQTLSYQLTGEGRQIPLLQEPVLPADYAAITGDSPQLLFAVGASVAGFVIVLVLNRLAVEQGHVENR